MHLKTILFATSNKGKLLEAEKFLSPLGFMVEQKEIPYPELQAMKLEDVASFGIKWILEEKKVDDKIMIEDAGLFIRALNDFPGANSAQVFKSIGLDGILGLMEDEKDRQAHFESCIAYHDRDSGLSIFKGKVDGKIAREQKGDRGFGYDPIFVPKGESKTFAEMSTEEKNKLSHRAKSLKKLAEQLGKR